MTDCARCGSRRRWSLLGAVLLVLACSEQPPAAPEAVPAIEPGANYRFVEAVVAADPLLEVKARAGNEYRNVLRSPHRSRRLRVPSGAVLEFGVALDEIREPAPGPPARVRLLAETDAGSRELFSTFVRSGGEWSDQRIDLSRLAGANVEFVFEADTAGAAAVSEVVWSNPLLVTPGAFGRGRPNLILISLDTLAADHMGGYGYARDTTPNLDRLAEESLVFENCIAPSSWTTPSHATVFTGLPLAVHGAGSFLGFRLRKGFTTLAELARAEGMATAAFTDGVAIGGQLGFYQGFDRYSNGIGIQPAPPGSAAETFRRAGAWLETRGERPFLLFLHTYEIHWPYRAPPPFFERFAPAGAVESEPEHLTIDTATAEDKDRYRARYDEGIAYTDHATGTFIEFLRETGRLEDTIVIIFSDHGEEFWEHGATGHGLSLYDEVLRVPLIIRLPAQDAPRGRVDRPVALADLFATAVELLGLESPEAVDSRSLVPLWDEEGGHPTYDRTLVTSELIQRGVHWLMLSGRHEEWKYIVTTDADHEQSPLHGWEHSAADAPAAAELALLDFVRQGGRDLSRAASDEERQEMFLGSREEHFDLTRDPDEARDLVFDSPEDLPGYRAVLRTAFGDFARAAGAQGAVGETVEPLTEAEKRDLQALGYLE